MAKKNKDIKYEQTIDGGQKREIAVNEQTAPLMRGILNQAQNTNTPTQTQTPQNNVNVSPTLQTAQKKEPRIYSNEKGETTGIEIDGKTYFGINQKDVDTIMEAYNSKRATPVTATGTEQATKKNIAQEQLEKAEETTKMLMTQDGEKIEPTKLDVARAFGESILSAGPGAVGGAVVGAVGGPAAPITATGGAIIGASSTALKAFRSEIRAQINENLQGKSTDLEKMKTNLNTIIANIQANPQMAGELISDFFMQVSLIERNFGQINADLSSDYAKRFGVDGVKQLTEYNAFLREGGELDNLKVKLANAVSQI